jgi:hypothetical protein
MESFPSPDAETEASKGRFTRMLLKNNPEKPIQIIRVNPIGLRHGNKKDVRGQL